jgi:carbohydrate-binding DOMON domain-containing protein
MSTQYRLVQSGKTASGGCSAGQGSSDPVAPRIYLFLFILTNVSRTPQYQMPLKSALQLLSCYKQTDRYDTANRYFSCLLFANAPKK